MGARIEPRVCWLIGDPVSHSLSPLLHNAAFKRMGLPHVYVPLRLPRRMLGPFFRLLPEARTLGLNVTVPHKESVLQWVNRLSPQARSCGAVNCVRVRGTRIEGYNTDGSGFLSALKQEAGFDVRGRKVVILGAGGAAKAIAHAVAGRNPAAMIILNRTASRARRLATKLRSTHPSAHAEGWGLSPHLMEAAGKDGDLIVQTTAVGLDGRSALRFPFEVTSRRTLVTDIIYRPRQTPFLRAAGKAGRQTLGGWAMFLYQAAESFEIWTGRPAPISLMRRTLLSRLRTE